VLEYCPNATTLTKVELTKLTAAVPFTPGTTGQVIAFSHGTGGVTRGGNTNTTGAGKGVVKIYSGGRNNKFISTNAEIIHG
jgi:hypothetical protein